MDLSSGWCRTAHEEPQRVVHLDYAAAVALWAVVILLVAALLREFRNG